MFFTVLFILLFKHVKWTSLLFTVVTPFYIPVGEYFDTQLLLVTGYVVKKLCSSLANSLCNNSLCGSWSILKC